MDQDTTATEWFTEPPRTEPLRVTRNPTLDNTARRLAALETAMETRRSIESHTAGMFQNMLTYIKAQDEAIAILRRRLDALDS